MAVDATRAEGGGRKAPLSIGGSEQRAHFSPEMQAVLEPNMAAIEAATLLDKPPAYLAMLRRAAREFKFELTEADRDTIATLKRDKSSAPAKREDLVKAVRNTSRNAQQAEWRRYRIEARRWVRIVRSYDLDRNWSAQFELVVRKAILLKIEREVDRAFRNTVPSLNKEEDRRRARARRELGKDLKRKRRQFGWRGAGDGRTPHLIPLADGSYDPVAIATAEFASLTADQSRGEANHGVYILGGRVSGTSKIDPALLTTEQRTTEALIARLQGEVRRFKQLRKLDGTSN